MIALVYLAVAVGCLLIAAVLVRRADRIAREREVDFNRTLGRIRRGGRVTLHRFKFDQRAHDAAKDVSQ